MPLASPNPFEVLRLDPTTPNEEVVRVAGRLRQLATDQAAVAAIRQAVQALTGNEEERRLHELRTHARPCYHWPRVDQFIAEFRRPPQPVEGTAPTQSPSDLDELAGLLAPLIAKGLEVSKPTDEPATTPKSQEDLRREIIQACWRNLLVDTRA
jgi:hypothetical protein